jgi:hypothetical protein
MHYCRSMGMSILLLTSSWEPLTVTAFTWQRRAAVYSSGVLCHVPTPRTTTTVQPTKEILDKEARRVGRYALLKMSRDDGDSDDDDTIMKTKIPGPAMATGEYTNKEETVASVPISQSSRPESNQNKYSETEDDNVHANDDKDDSSSQYQTMSKAKWKKKKFLMTRDVTTLIRNGDPAAPKKAQEMIRRMWTLHQNKQASDTSDDSQAQFMPDTASYNLYLYALAKSAGSCDNKDVAVQAEQVIRNMLELGIRPNVVSYTSVMDAYAQQSSHDPTAAAQAERILFELLALGDTPHTGDPIANTNPNTSTPQEHSTKVTSVTADTVLNAWAQQGTEKGAARAQQILERLEEAAIHSGRSPTTSSIRPTVFSYATVIHAWAQVGGTQGAEQAQEVLDRLLQRLANKKDRCAVHPDNVVFNAVMHAWANSGDPAAGSKAVLLLRQMQELHVRHKYDCAPDTVSFNTVLSAWSHGGHMNAATQAERILQEMVTANRQTPEHAPPPNTVSYNSVLHAWSQSPLPGAAERAEAVLEFMIRAKKPDIAPDVYSFTSVLNALAKSKEPNKAQRARARLDQLLEIYATSRDPSLRPSQVTFNTVLNGCKYSIH